MITRYRQILNEDKEQHSNPHFRHFRLIHFVRKMTRPFEKDYGDPGQVLMSDGTGVIWYSSPTQNKVKSPYENLQKYPRRVFRNTGRRVF